MPIDRRNLLAVTLGAAACGFCRPAAAARFLDRTGLSRGRFIWEPSQPPDGPVLILVSLRDRLVHVFRHGELVAISACRLSRGRKPAGIFLVTGPAPTEAGTPLAAVPPETGLFWTAAALDADNALRNTRSMAFVRVPAAFARLLAGIAEPGTVAVVAPLRTPVRRLEHAGPLSFAAARVPGDAAAAASGTGPSAAIVVSAADRRAVLLQDGVPRASAAVMLDGRRERLGTQVYWLLGRGPGTSSLQWLAVGLAGSGNDPSIATWRPEAVLGRVRLADPEQASAMAQAMHPGAVLIVTDRSMPGARRKRLQNGVILAGDDVVRPHPGMAAPRAGRRYAGGP